MKTTIRNALLSVLLLMHMPSRGEDIDLFVSSTLNDADLPNVLFVLDNTANWNTVFTSEMAALAYVFQELPPDTFKVGIMMFSETGGGNSNVDGGYVRAAVREMTEDNKKLYADLINSLDVLNDKSNGGKTSLVMMEAYNYFKGGTPDGGNNKNKADYANNVFGTAQSQAIYALGNNALSAKDATKYNTPVGSGCAKKFIIYISNGTPSDNVSDIGKSKTALGNAGGNTGEIPLSPTGSQKYMNDEWAKFMKDKEEIVTYALDINPGTTGQGPGWSASLRSMSETNGGGRYFVVNGNDPVDVANTLLNVLNEIQAVNSVFAAANLPVSADSQGVFLNQVFYGMFRPDGQSRPRWNGNLKQYKIGFTDSTETAMELKDAAGKPAVSSTTGFMENCVQSYWTAPTIPPVPTDLDNTTYDPIYQYWAFSPRQGCRDAVIRYQYQSLNYGDPAGTASTSDWPMDRSDTPDGPLVEKGGHASLLRAIDSTTRYTTTCSTTFADCRPGVGPNNGLLPFDSSNTDITNADLDVSGGPGDRDQLIEWARGQDNGSGDGSGNALKPEKAGGTTMRPSVHGDVVHSRPLAINYGTYTNPNVIVFYGANDGYLRAIDGSEDGSGAGQELWAFMPPEFLYDEVNKVGNLERLRSNAPENYYPKTPEANAIQKAYGFDGALVSYNANTDGDPEYDTVWLYGALRRGGRALYGFDVSNIHNDPKDTRLLWKVGCPNVAPAGDPFGNDDSGCTPDFERIGQTWSPPVVEKSHDDINQVKLVFGGGYDTCEDLDVSSDPGCHDKGNIVYVLDGETGNLLTKPDQLLTDRAVVSEVSFMRDSAGAIVYGYVSDMGGNLYRISGAGANDNQPIKNSPPDTWRFKKIASLGCSTDTTCVPENRKFMFAPELIVNPFTGLVHIMIGTGDREKPLLYYKNAALVENYFFSVIDKPSDPNWFDYSACADLVCLDSLTRIDRDKDSPDTISKYGWYLTMDPTEQVINESVTAYGTTYFGTHIPAVPAAGTCSSLGTARVYKVYYKDASPRGGNSRYKEKSNGGMLTNFAGGPVDVDGDGDAEQVLTTDTEDWENLDGGTPASSSKSKVYWNVEQ